MGIAEFHPLNGERLIPEEHPVLGVEATSEKTLDIVNKLDAHRVVMTHIEESDGLGHDDVTQVSGLLRERGLEAMASEAEVAVLNHRNRHSSRRRRRRAEPPTADRPS
jgi:hypothetical protein